MLSDASYRSLAPAEFMRVLVATVRLVASIMTFAGKDKLIELDTRPGLSMSF